jgi:hypothetical protein
VSWCAATNGDIDLARAVDLHVMRDAAGELGSVLLEMGDAHRGVVPQVPNNSTLVLLLLYPGIRFGGGIVEGLTVEDIEGVRATIAGAVERLARSRSAREDAALVVDEVAAAAALVDLLCRDAQARLAGDGTLPSVPAAARRAFAGELGDLVDRHRSLWLARNRPGGLADSCRRLEALRDSYRA